MRVAAHQLSLVILHTMDNRERSRMFVIITSLIKPLVYYGIRSHRAQHIFFSLTNEKRNDNDRRNKTRAERSEGEGAEGGGRSARVRRKIRRAADVVGR